MEANIMKYIDSIDWDAKNQLGKALEHYFYEKQHREYTSCMESMVRLMQQVRHIIIIW